MELRDYLVEGNRSNALLYSVSGTNCLVLQCLVFFVWAPSGSCASFYSVSGLPIRQMPYCAAFRAPSGIADF
eukprot:4976356-Amphidinium_carterae.1